MSKMKILRALKHFLLQYIDLSITPDWIEGFYKLKKKLA